VLVLLVLAGSLYQDFGFALAGAGEAAGILGDGGSSLAPLSPFAVLGLGFIFGLKHATEVDHIVAVSTIVSEHKNVWRSALVGGLWGVGHTASLVIIGVVVLALRVTIPESVSNWLELGVALMIITLGVSAIRRALRGRADVHLHRHSHDDVSHIHLHFHEHGTEHAKAVASHSHALKRVGIRPLLVGAAHGLAGSAALTLLVLTQIESTALGLLFLAVFGVGSVLGMLLMSGLIGLPFALTARRPSGTHSRLQTIAGALSVAFGLWYAYQTGVTGGLWGTLL
jgi:ABC-type nickel/cobalt efflux system permease component RcnA